MLLAAACARQGAPPGGPEDRRPPVVIRTVPDTFAVVSEFRGPVRFEFDERISERVQGGSPDDAVVVSPRTGDVRVRLGRRAVEVELEGGFRPGLVYRVTLLPVVSDLFSNTMRDPFELVFSTGPAPVPTTVAGIAWDRLTGRGMADVDVLAQRLDPARGGLDSTVHVARTDTGGVYAFRYIPDGRFQLLAFQDRDRDGVADTMEVQGTARVLVGEGDTLILNIPMLPPDTSPARLVRVEPLDSLRLLVEFDDYLDPDLPLATTVVTVLQERDSTVWTTGRAMHAHEYLAWAAAVADSLAVLDSLEAAERAAARADSLARADSAAAADTEAAEPADTTPPPDTAEADSVAQVSAAPDTTLAQEVVRPEARAADRPPRRRPPPGLDGRPVRRPDPEAERREPRGPGGERLPSQQAVALLERSLERGVPYRVRVQGVLNIAGIPLGGGEAVIVLEALPDSAAADSAAVDTSGAAVPPDTGGVGWRRP